MGIDNSVDPFGGNDFVWDGPLDQQDSVTPVFGKMKTTGSAKLLVVIFVVDCSMTMAGDRIAAVNAALQEVKYKLNEIKEDNALDLQVAIMSFTSSAKWELELTPIEELDLKTIKTRPGLTEYGTAFHELNKVLRKDKFMKHTGKVAPPAIMFLTDGEPTDDYQSDLDELLKNGWFANASRCAVLLGDAIYNDAAKKAVSQFVNDADSEIVTAEDSTVIIQKVKIATMHTVAGDPIATMGSSDSGSNTGGDDPFGGNSTGGDDLFGGSSTGGDDPFGGSNTGGDDPFGGSNTGGDDPFGGNGTGGDDPFGGSSTGGDDPFGGSNPFDGLI